MHGLGMGIMGESKMTNAKTKSNGDRSYEVMPGQPGMYALTADGKTRISGEALDAARKQRKSNPLPDPATGEAEDAAPKPKRK